MATTTEITLDQLASVDAKLLFQALEMRLASAGVIKKRGVKKVVKASTSSAASDDGASQSGRSVGEGTKAHNEQTKTVAALVKTALDGEKGGAGFHLKVLSVLRKEMGLVATAEPTLESVRAAITFLKENPEWKSPNQQSKAAKAEPASSSSGPVVVKSDAPAKPKGRPAKSAEEKAAEAAAKKAEKEAAAAAKKAEKEAAAAAKKTAKKPAAKKDAAPAVAEVVTEEASGELVEIELDGVSYFWDEASGAVFDNIDGHTGDRIGLWNGTDSEITRD